MASQISVALLLLLAAVAVLASDPLTVLVGYKDGGVAGFQSQFHPPSFCAHTPNGTFVINDSPSTTSLELKVSDTTRFANADTRKEFGIAAKGVPTLTVFESTLTTTAVEASLALNVHGSKDPSSPLADQPRVPTGEFTLGGIRQWGLWAHDDFNTPATGAGWFVVDQGKLSSTSVSEKRQGCNGSNDLHLGGYCSFATVEVGKLFAGLPAHRRLRVTARVHFIDSWRGEHVYAKLNGALAWSRSHSYCYKAFSSFCRGVDACGDNKFPDALSQQVSFELAHEGPEALVSFGADLAGVSACAASWAVDDVMVYLK